MTDAVLDQTLLDDLVARIVEAVEPEKVILFGSWANGTARPDSDLDLFVEMESDESPPERARAVSRLFGLRKWAMDVVVYTPEEARRLSNVVGTLMHTIECEGKVLYERG